MSASGIIRKIDDLGRIVIPKEIRKALRIKVGEPLEISVMKEGIINIKKYSPITDISYIAKDFASSINEATKYICIITDTDSIISVSGVSKREFENQDISKELFKILDLRNFTYLKDRSTIKIYNDDKNIYSSQAISPIISNGDIIGSVILISLSDEKIIPEIDTKIVKTASIFLGTQVEI